MERVDFYGFHKSLFVKLSLYIPHIDEQIFCDKL